MRSNAKQIMLKDCFRSLATKNISLGGTHYGKEENQSAEIGT